jgi:YbbR domain-containing protein
MIDIPGRRKLPVQVDWEGRLPPDILVQDVEVVPSHIEVSGGQQIIDQLRTIYTQKVVVDDLRASGEIEAAIALAPASLKLAPHQPDRVRIRYRIVPRP